MYDSSKIMEDENFSAFSERGVIRSLQSCSSWPKLFQDDKLGHNKDLAKMWMICGVASVE